MNQSLTADERTNRARVAAETRWGKRFDWDSSPLDECKDKLADLRAEMERGGLILQRRMSIERITSAECYSPTCLKGPVDKDGNRTRTIIDITSGRFAGSRTRYNDATGLPETAYACSAACFLYLSSNFKHGSAAVRDVPVKDEEPEVVLNEVAKNII